MVNYNVRCPYCSSLVKRVPSKYNSRWGSKVSCRTCGFQGTVRFNKFSKLCKNCGTLLTSSNQSGKHRLCKRCRAQYDKTYKNKRYQLVKDQIGDTCIFCGNERVHLHHVVPIDNHHVTHYIQNMDILMPLCPQCHSYWHQLKEGLELMVM